jgi:hypothetical protein
MAGGIIAHANFTDLGRRCPCLSNAPRGAAPRSVGHAPPPLAQLEDFRRAVGRRVADTLTASLSIREVRWRPEGAQGAELPAFTFVEDGQPARVPGPLLRAVGHADARAVAQHPRRTTRCVWPERPCGGAWHGLPSCSRRANAPRSRSRDGRWHYYYWARPACGAASDRTRSG